MIKKELIKYLPFCVESVIENSMLIWMKFIILSVLIRMLRPRRRRI